MARLSSLALGRVAYIHMSTATFLYISESIRPNWIAISISVPKPPTLIIYPIYTEQTLELCRKSYVNGS